ncbi:MAG: hypothetical protein GXY83_34545 [Rhodopirellula sp.]|nr:hypothetical protein [Rhodopirellula sp.]
MTQPDIRVEAQTEVLAPKVATRRTCSSWPAAVACVCFFAATALLLRAYGFLHWEILFRNGSTISNPIRADLLRLLGYLEVFRLTALCSVGFGIWAFRGQPRCLRWICLPFALLSLLWSLVVM